MVAGLRKCLQMAPKTRDRATLTSSRLEVAQCLRNGGPMQRIANEEMSSIWNGVSGRAWVDEQQLLDRTYAPIEKLLAGEVAARGARAVLDIGCGSGATTLAVARSL